MQRQRRDGGETGSLGLASRHWPLGTLTTIMESVAGARGWRRAAIAFVAGAASALAQAPTHLWPILFLTFPLLVWLIDGTSSPRWREIRTCALIGWCFGFGYFLVGFYWLGHAFLVEAETFGWLLPIAVPAVPAGLAIFTALALALARLLWTSGALRVLALAIALTITEWLRGHVLTGFPWNTFGYALTSPLELAQSASLIGIWGLTFIAVAVFASPAALADHRTRWLPMLSALAVVAAMAVFGSWRLSKMPTSLVDGVELRIMQPNLPQDDKFNYAAKAQVMSRYIKLSTAASDLRPNGLRGTTHLIWPESAFPFYLAHEADAIAQIAELLPEGTVLITGADRIYPSPGAEGAEAHNSVYVLDHDGSVVARSDKVHLVPFGEYLPFQKFLERLGLKQLTRLEGGFSAGDRLQLIAVPRAPPAVALICYEIIFPGDVLPRDERPGWLINLTNDGWFGISSGPYQHFQQARVRAIEEGLPVVRAANTGISAVIDPVGRVMRSLPLGAEAVLDAGLPRPISPTLYARFGDGLAGLMLAIGFAVLAAHRLRRQ